MRKISLTLLSLVILTTTVAEAQRVSPLEGQPAVRKRLLLRNSRIELAPTVGFALNRDFYHTILAGAKAEYHLNDYFSLGVTFGYGAANIKTGLTDNILAQLPDLYSADAENQLVPSKDMALNPMLQLKYLLGVQGAVTPFFGKMALFGKVFFNYDFYAFAGFGAAGMSDKCSAGACTYVDAAGATIDYANPSKGFKPGFTYGVGLHLFFNNWIALNCEIRDTVVRNNLAGRDMNWDPQYSDAGLLPPAVTSDDTSFDNILTVTLGASFYLPRTAEVSR